MQLSSGANGTHCRWTGRIHPNADGILVTRVQSFGLQFRLWDIPNQRRCHQGRGLLAVGSMFWQMSLFPQQSRLPVGSWKNRSILQILAGQYGKNHSSDIPPIERRFFKLRFRFLARNNCLKFPYKLLPMSFQLSLGG